MKNTNNKQQQAGPLRNLSKKQNQQINFRNLLRRKASNIRQSCFKLYTNNNRENLPYKKSNKIVKRQSNKLQQSAAEKKGFSVSQQTLNQISYSISIGKKKSTSNSSFLDMFTKISCDTKQQVKRRKKQKYTHSSSSSFLQNTISIIKVTSPRLRMNNTFTGKFRHSLQTAPKHNYQQNQQKYFVDQQFDECTSKIDMNRTFSNHKINQQIMVCKIKRGSNFSKSSSTPKKFNRSQNKTLKTQNNFKQIMRWNKDEQQLFRPLGKLTEILDSQINYKSLNGSHMFLQQAAKNKNKHHLLYKKHKQKIKDKSLSKLKLQLQNLQDIKLSSQLNLKQRQIEHQNKLQQRTVQKKPIHPKLSRPAKYNSSKQISKQNNSNSKIIYNKQRINSIHSDQNKLVKSVCSNSQSENMMNYENNNCIGPWGNNRS